MGGWFYGITRGHGMKNVFLRMEQFRLARDETTCLSLARQFVHGKIRNHRTLLMRHHLEPPEAIIGKLRASEDALAPHQLRNLESRVPPRVSIFSSSAAWSKLKTICLASKRRKDPGNSPSTSTQQPQRRPPTIPSTPCSPVQHVVKDCTLAALAVGFDPYLGFYHQPRFDARVGSDLMEEFRPLVAESTVLSCINNRVVTEKDFVRAGQAVNLPHPGETIFQTYEQRMSSLITSIVRYKVSYRRAWNCRRDCWQNTDGEIAEYIPLMTR
jgi:CRISPR-associated protein Cas1